MYTDLQVNISWSEPINPNGIITSYRVVLAETDNSSSVAYNTSSLSEPNVTVLVDVLPFTDYTVSVFASTSVGEGAGQSIVVLSPEAGKNVACVHTVLCHAMHLCSVRVCQVVSQDIKNYLL